jgi:hypothetical protein
MSGLAIQEKSLGPSHSDLVHTLRAYALLVRKAKRKPEAAVMETRAREILARSPALPSAQQTVDVRGLGRGGKAWKQ